MRKFSLTIFPIFGLVMLYASQSWAGSAGNGAAQWNKYYGNKPAQATYSYCFDQWTKDTVYYSPVFTSAPKSRASDLEAAFRSYLTKTFGVGSVGSDTSTCDSRLDMKSATLAKKDSEAVTQENKLIKIVETNWAGAGVASAASSPATPPAASANAQTSAPPAASANAQASPPPAAQAVTETAAAQVGGQIKQAGQSALNKLFHH